MSRARLIRGLQSGAHTLPAGLLLAILYAIACWATRQISLDQFFLPAGIRIAALLALPIRMWPYLMLGEYAYFAQVRLPLADTYGLTWVLVASAYQFPLVATLAYLHRGSLMRNAETGLLTLAATAAVSVGAGNLILMQAFWQSPVSEGVFSLAARFVLGHYSAILAIAPLVILATRRIAPSRWLMWLQAPSAACLILMLLAGYATALVPTGDASERTALQLLMAAPAILLTCIHGWRGAAVCVPLLNFFVHFMTPVSGLPGSFDRDTFTAQQSLALVSTALLALGSITSHYRRRLDRSMQDQSHALHLAKSSYLAGEKELRARAQRMSHIGDHIDFALNQTVEWLNEQGHRQFASGVLTAITISSRNFREQTSLVYPTPLEHVGLYLALQGCGISETWEKTGRVNCIHFSGDPCQLSTDLQLAAYRTVIEAVSILLEHESGQVWIRARSGRSRHLQGIVMTIKASGHSAGLSPKSIEMAMRNLTSRAVSYGGKLQCRRSTIRFVLVEKPGEAALGNQRM